MTFAQIIIFLCGISNFWAHKAVMETDHPFVRDSKEYFGKYMGKWGSLSIEFMLLLAAFIGAAYFGIYAIIIYVIYSGFNLISAWVLLTGRI
ncbi:hypothetical protein LPB140_03800 [Sphingorhabdus lutea]|uniref:Uncharacterized protein n=1 Tax=Sphingorhabdus lutea TaxID=1913578 RepID=A0A1L3JAB8_9SPHN|nr:hypothetical protein [Sphingorhabdus lutea]APG62080.1 hypothetical protein LPB140_03800 [Sphingorhabdus lutea]